MSPALTSTVGAPIDDDLWSAIGDPTRRRLLDLLLRDGEGTATTLSQGLPVTRQAVAKHLSVLDRVGLVHGAPAGRERRFQVDDAQLSRAVAQLTSVGAAWDARLGRIRRIAEALEQIGAGLGAGTGTGSTGAGTGTGPATGEAAPPAE